MVKATMNTNDAILTHKAINNINLLSITSEDKLKNDPRPKFNVSREGSSN